MDDHRRLVKALDLQPPLAVYVMLEETLLLVF